MPRHAERLSRRWAIALVAPLLVASCGGDDGDEGSDAGGLAALVTTTTTVELSSSETEPPTSTTVAPTTTVPERLEEDDLRSLLLQPGDVPEGLIEEEFEPSGEFATDPPACGEVLNGDGPGEVQLAVSFHEEGAYLVYESFVDHTPGSAEDLDEVRAAIAGPCSETFTLLADPPLQQRLEPLPDPDLGEDSLAARIFFEFVHEGQPVTGEGYMVYFRRGDVWLQVQVVTAVFPGLEVREVSFDEVLRAAELVDRRAAALLTE